MAPIEKIVVIVAGSSERRILLELLAGAGFSVQAYDSEQTGIEAARDWPADLVLLDADLSRIDCCQAVTDLKSLAATRDVRLILLGGETPAERARALDLGADDAVPRSIEPAEMLARVRSQLRVSRDFRASREKSSLAEQGQAIAHTAFQALAVTEKLTQDAFTLDRRLKVGLAALLAAAAVMATIFFFFSRRAVRETDRVHAVISRIERSIRREQDLVERSRRMREELERVAAGALSEHKQQLQQQSEELRAKMAAADAEELSRLRKQLDQTDSHLRRIETESKVAQGIIRSYAPSVCLLHVSVAFRHLESGRRLRYAGLNSQGDPIQDSGGNPIFDLDGRGPEVRAEFFGTGFLAAPGGRILTNRHVVEPWWKSAEMGSLTQEGYQPIIAEMSAYFPGAQNSVRVATQKVSPDADLALVAGEAAGTRRAVPALDVRREAAVSGQPVVLLGYATGLDAILARAGEETVRAIVAAANGDPKQILAELARRNLIRPLATQGHVGDVLPDKIVYDAQTASGGSGGPLFNQQGKVVGVNYAVVRGFGGSNFGIPVRFAQPLLKTP